MKGLLFIDCSANWSIRRMRMTDQRRLSPREKRFCDLYARLGDESAAARSAGYPEQDAHISAARLLSREDIMEAVGRRLRIGKRQAGDLALTGLCKLAFGSIGDGVRLLREGDALPPEELRELDLFPVSELRRGKDGSYEARFYDRMKALELLLEYGGGGDEASAGGLYDALQKGAEALGREALDV